MASINNNTNNVKILLVGDLNVGKTSLLMRYTENTFTYDTVSTIGVDFKQKKIFYDNEQYNLQIWDTAGHERFQTMTSSYYRGADVIIMVYDVTNSSSFQSIDKWIKEIERYSLNSVFRILVGNKCDLIANKVVDSQTGENYAESLGIPFIETSCKDDINIEESLSLIISEVLNYKKNNKKNEENCVKINCINIKNFTKKKVPKRCSLM